MATERSALEKAMEEAHQELAHYLGGCAPDCGGSRDGEEAVYAAIRAVGRAAFDAGYRAAAKCGPDADERPACIREETP